MQEQASWLTEFGDRVSAYLPTLAGGLLVLGLGIAAGWVAKRAVVRILIWLRLDRLAGRVGWRAALGKGDVRSALYEALGTAVMAVVILIFLDNALQIMGLTVLSRMIDSVVFYLLNLALVALIVGVGILVTNVVADPVEDALEEEEFEHARLLARGVKAVLWAVVGALALWQLAFAREIVLAAFLIAFGSVGVAFALAVGIGSAPAIQRGWESLLGKKRQR
ncbi:hypothetical protein HRbin33_02209 [bacterium HR33]|nr:hypothetical protein HRbin33_02209 [bacterium HR33]